MQVNAFIVRKGTPGLETRKIENKTALRCVQNADIFLKDVFVPESDRLPGVQSFQDTNKVRRLSCSGAALSVSAAVCRGARTRSMQVLHLPGSLVAMSLRSRHSTAFSLVFLSPWLMKVERMQPGLPTALKDVPSKRLAIHGRVHMQQCAGAPCCHTCPPVS